MHSPLNSEQTSTPAPSRTPLDRQQLQILTDSLKKIVKSVFCFSFAINLLMLTVPLYLLQVYDKVLTVGNSDSLYVLTLFALACILAYGWLESIRYKIVVKESSKIDSLLGVHVLSSIMDKRGNISPLHDLEKIRGFMGSPALFPLLDLPWTPLFLGILFWLHPYIGLLVSATAIALLLVAYANQRSTQDLTGAGERETRHAQMIAAEFSAASDVVTAMGMKEPILYRWHTQKDEGNRQTFEAGLKNASYTTLAKFLRTALQIAVIFTAAYLVLKGQLTGGAIIASVLLTGRALAPIEQSIMSWRAMLLMHASFKKLRNYLEVDSSVSHQCLTIPSGPLRAESLIFATRGFQNPLLRNLHLEINPGEAVGIVGDSAAGKSTLAKILVGALPAGAGKVTLGGFDTADWTREELGPYIGYIPQSPTLFAGTVKDNISRFQNDPVEWTIEAAMMAGIHEKILQMPDGYMTEVGTNGSLLSGGQSQRIALARALYGRQKLLVLDEPDANLDIEGRRCLYSAIEQAKKAHVMILVISHSGSMLAHMDRVLRLADGQLHKIKKPPNSLKPAVPVQPELTYEARKPPTHLRHQAGI